MVPRAEIISISINDSMEKILNTINIETHSRMPVFKNNLDMTVSVAKNLEIYIDNFNLERNVYVYGLGDMLPRGIDTIKRARSWRIEELTPEFIKQLNLTEKQKKSNNRITMTFLAPQ